MQMQGSNKQRNNNDENVFSGKKVCSVDRSDGTGSNDDGGNDIGGKSNNDNDN